MALSQPVSPGSILFPYQLQALSSHLPHPFPISHFPPYLALPTLGSETQVLGLWGFSWSPHTPPRYHLSIPFCFRPEAPSRASPVFPLPILPLGVPLWSQGPSYPLDPSALLLRPSHLPPPARSSGCPGPHSSLGSGPTPNPQPQARQCLQWGDRIEKITNGGGGGGRGNREEVGVGSRGPEPREARSPGGGRSYLLVAPDRWLAPSAIPGSGASGGRRRPLPAPLSSSRLQSPPRRRRRRPRPPRRAAPIPLPPPPGPDRPPAPEQIPIKALAQPLPRPATSPPAARNARAAPPAGAAPLAPAAPPALRSPLARRLPPAALAGPARPALERLPAP